MNKRRKSITPLLLFGLLALPVLIPNFALASSSTNRMTFQTTGPAVPLGFQRINNPSFETGTSSWAETAYNNYSSIVSIVQGYNDNSAAQLMITSGNLTVDSHLALVQDFSKSPVGFDNSARLRAAVQVGSIQGNSATDRIEVEVDLVTSFGTTGNLHYVFSHLSSIPANTTSDSYFGLNWSGTTGWILLDRNVANDAFSAFPNLATNLNSIKSVELTTYATSAGIPNYDSRIKYWETGGENYWNTTETVVYDPDNDGHFNPSTDWILLNKGTPPLMQQLSNDPRIKFVDSNLDGVWDPGKPIVYDLFNEGIYDIARNDPVINGTVAAGTLLQHPLRVQTSATFDQVELYTSNGQTDVIHNGSFNTGTLSGWGNTAGFNIVTSPVLNGTYSVQGTANGNTIDLAQSIDAKPSIDSTTKLYASAYLSGMTGATASDKLDVWIGLVDSSPTANPLSIYYYYKTGTGAIPSNTTDTVNHKVPGFGSFAQWLSVGNNLLSDTGYFNLTGHTAPYRIEAIVLEASAQATSTTTAYFDVVSLSSYSPPLPASSTYYATDGLNSTYSYTAIRVPQSAFYLAIPSAQNILNITAPGGNTVQASGYSTQVIAGLQLITVPLSTSLKYQALGDWRIYTTSKNALTALYATTSPGSNSSTNFKAGDSATFVSRVKDPNGTPILGANVTFLFYSSTTQVFKGTTNDQGWYNQTNVALPQDAGTNILEAITVSPSYIGLRTTPLTINSSFPWAIIIYASIAAAAAVLFGLFYLKSGSKRRGQASTPTTPSTAKQNTPGQRRVDKGKLAACNIDY